MGYSSDGAEVQEPPYRTPRPGSTRAAATLDECLERERDGSFEQLPAAADVPIVHRPVRAQSLLQRV